MSRLASAWLALVIASACTTPAASPTATASPSATASATASPSPVAIAPSTPRPAVRDPFRCTERVDIPTIEHVVYAAWSPDSTTLALGHIVTLSSTVTITGWEEEMFLDALDLRTGELRPIGVGERPQWSASGRYLAYWGWDGTLRVVRGGLVLEDLQATLPEFHWVGDDLLFVSKDKIETWDPERSVRTLAHLPDYIVVAYPSNDLYWSADGEHFTLTRYSLDGNARRYLGTTRTGDLAALDVPDATFMEWAPSGDTLFVQYPDRIELRDLAGGQRTVPLRSFAGAVHGWTPDGRAVVVGQISPTIPAGDRFDEFAVWGADGEPEATATLPNLLGTRQFSPNGEYFTGVSRTGLYGTRLELYRCGSGPSGSGASTGDPTAAARLAAIQADRRRFARPVAGEITQFVQGSHTGIDVAAPFGSVIVASDDGVVDAVGWFQVGGRRVCVLHARGLESCYYHTSAALVSLGDRVVRGQPIALIGMTGVTTGPHVHWEAKLLGRIVDPLAQ
jgi:murein DD-endopeptidase MepM/ murein hydrolase activator NlpD